MLKIVSKRFPSLFEQAEVQAACIEQPDVLDTLIEQLLQTTDEGEARNLLEQHPAS